MPVSIGKIDRQANQKPNEKAGPVGPAELAHQVEVDQQTKGWNQWPLLDHGNESEDKANDNKQ